MPKIKKVVKRSKASAAKKPAVSRFKTYADIKSVSDAMEIMGYTIKDRPFIDNLPQHLQQVITSEFDKLVMHEAYNKIMNFVPDPSDENQKKYWTWRWVKRVPKSKKYPSGLGFSCTRTGCGDTGTGVGPRLCVGTQEAAIDIATRHEYLWIGSWF